jgi:diketogulonate reductase-like aldo/keto reductase
LIEATHKAFERLGTDTIDLLQLHHFDAMTPVEQVKYSNKRLSRASPSTPLDLMRSVSLRMSTWFSMVRWFSMVKTQR